MKTSLYLTLFLFVSSFFSCQDESNSIGEKGVGYLTLNVGTSSATNTRAAEYNPKQIAVQIVNLETEAVVEETEDWEIWEGEKFALETGTYGIYASSAGFDGSSPEFEKPYYVGSDTIDIVPNTNQTANITCRLANVKLTVDFSFFRDNKFKAASVEVSAGSSSLTFSMGKPTEEQAGYFPVKPLTANLTVTNKNGTVHTLETSIKDAKARDHIILKYKSGEAEQGESGISVTVDETTKTYTYIIPVEMKEVAAGLEAKPVNAWSTFAYLEGKASVKGMELDNSLVQLQYKTLEAPGWTPLDATFENETFKAKATGLTPETKYQYRMYYHKNEDTEYVSDTVEFTTEKTETLYNGNFDNWAYGTGTYENTWFADFAQKQEGFNYVAGFNTSFWDSGNIGTSTGMAAMLGAKNPTAPEASIVHTLGGNSAKLASIYVVIQFAAGNIYTGNYQETIMSPMGARINWGQPFTSRPTALHGWIQYTPGTVNRGNDANLPADATLHLGDTDQNAIYIALSDKGSQYEINNGEKKFIDFENDPNIIAYGELPQAECVKTDGWKEVTIPLVYRAFDRKPTHIIIVFSASKYGDYFVGSDNSVMYIDDFELIYGDEPKVKE